MTINLLNIYKHVTEKTMIYSPITNEVEFNEKPLNKIKDFEKEIYILRNIGFFSRWYAYDIEGEKVHKKYKKGESDEFDEFHDFEEQYFAYDNEKNLLFLNAYEIQFSGGDYVSRGELIHKRWKIPKSHICCDHLINPSDLLIYRTTNLKKKKAFCILYPAHHIEKGLEERTKKLTKGKFNIECKKVEDIEKYISKKRLTFEKSTNPESLAMLVNMCLKGLSGARSK